MQRHRPGKRTSPVASGGCIDIVVCCIDEATVVAVDARAGGGRAASCIGSLEPIPRSASVSITVSIRVDSVFCVPLSVGTSAISCPRDAVGSNGSDTLGATALWHSACGTRTNHDLW